MCPRFAIFNSGGAGLTTAIVWLLAVIFTISPGAADDWPRWRGIDGTGRWVDAPRVAESWPKELDSVWRTPIGPGFSGISVQGDFVYSMDRDKQREQERVVCLSRATGKLVWEHLYRADYGDLDHGKGPRSMPLIHQGRVYTLGAVGRLSCLEALTGKPIWAKELVKDHQAKQPTWGFASPPVVYKQDLIVHAGLQPGGCYVGFDLKTGNERWRAGDDPIGYAAPVITSHRGRDLLIGWTPENVLGISLKEHRVLWRQPYKVTYGVAIATPIVRDSLVVVCGYWEGSKAIRLGPKATDAELAWEENRNLRGLMAQPLVQGEHAYLLDRTQGLVCFELASGKMIWNDRNRLTPRARNPQATMVWLGDSKRILALNADGELIHARLSPSGYQELGRAPLVGETWAHPAYASGCVFARDDKQIVCARLPVQAREDPR